MTEEMRMNAYYYSFSKTGVIEIDRILSALAIAGKRYHHTGDWDEEIIGPIQKAAEEAAKYFSPKYAMNWIKVTDRLPDVNKPVLIYYKNEYGYDRILRAIRSDGKSFEADEHNYDLGWVSYDDKTDTHYCPHGWYEFNEFEDVSWYVNADVTHWMPLPDPPEETK